MKYTIETIACGPYQANAYLLLPEDDNGAILIDPGDDLPLLKHRLNKCGHVLKGILLTHGHFDHMLSAQPLANITGAPVYIHAGDADMICDDEKNAYNAMAAAQPSPKNFEPELLDESIEIAGIKLQVLHTPGHSKGSACFYDGENGVLFSGDTLFCAGFGRMDLYGGSPKEMRASLRMLFRLPGETRVLCGHGYETTISDERSRYTI